MIGIVKATATEDVKGVSPTCNKVVEDVLCR